MGAALSVISHCSYQELSGSKPVEKTTMRLSLYGGSQLTVLSPSTVHVRHGASEADLLLIIMGGDGPSLLGRERLEQLCFDWKAVYKLLECTLDQVLQKHQEDTLQEYEAKYQVDANTQPKFYEARSVP